MIGNGLRPSIWKEFKERFGVETVAELYASSEGNIGFSNFFNMDNTVGFSTAPYRLVKYHEGTRDPIRNENGRLEEVDKGEPGLLIGEITKKWAFEGYTQKEATEKSILRDGFKKGDAWFNTGDVLKEIGCRHLQFVDRMGDAFRWKGENVSTAEVENIIDGSDMVQEAIVYGVEIPNTNGKAGMVTLVPHDPDKTFDANRLFAYLQDNLPPYAVPVFIRVTYAIEKTGTFKYRKADIQKLGYSLNRPHAEGYACLPRTCCYIVLIPDLWGDINAGGVRFERLAYALEVRPQPLSYGDGESGGSLPLVPSTRTNRLGAQARPKHQRGERSCRWRGDQSGHRAPLRTGRTRTPG